jgi:hypothetical protein
MISQMTKAIVVAFMVCSATVLCGPAALAQACYDYPNMNGPFSGPIPDCQPQVQAPIKYGWWETQGWAYYCSGDHPYFWGLAAGYPGDYSTNNSCFSSIENEFDEGTPNKFDATFTNWCWADEEIVVTLSCSDIEPPAWSGGCTTTGGPVPDPGCPQSNAHNYCTTVKFPPVCFQTYNETCGSTTYDCTVDLLATWCFQCK